MPKKLDYDDVRIEIKNKGCLLLSREYKSAREKLDILCICGHERSVSLNTFRAMISYKCRECSMGRYFTKDSKNREFKVKKSFDAIIKKLDKKLESSKKYRNDFVSSNYDVRKKCRRCGVSKRRFLFPNRTWGDGKDTICKGCITKDNIILRKNHSRSKIINILLGTCKYNCMKRKKSGRIEESKLSITQEQVETLVSKQNNKCVYTNKELIWEYNNNDKPSIDRINSNKGYTIDNIQLVTKIVNQMKSDLNENSFLEIIKNIYNYSIKKSMLDTQIQYVNSQLSLKKTDDFVKEILKRCITSSKKRHHGNYMKEISINEEDIYTVLKKQNNTCIYSGVPLLWYMGREKPLNKLSIDRKDSSIGYHKDNIQFTTYYVNVMKNDLDEKEFLDTVANIYNHCILNK